MVALALALGFVIGLAVFAVMNLSIWLTELIWNGTGTTPRFPWFSVVVCTLGGLVIGIWTHLSHDKVHELEEVLHEFKTTGSFHLESPGKAVVSFLLPLSFGGSVGFEAGLTGLITAGCCWIRDRLKAMGLAQAEVADATIAASLSAIFGAPLAGLVAAAESSHDVDDYNMRRSVKLVLYLAAAVGAFGGIHLFSSLLGNASGLPRFDAIAATGTEFLWIVPCLALAYLLTLIFHASDFGSRTGASILDTLPFGTIAKPVVAGFIIGLVAMAFPLVLFPGESQAHELMGTWQSWTAVALLATGLLKAAATPLCIRLGWIGGVFFPCIFAGVACGYGLATITGVDPMLLVTITTSGFLAGATRKPLLSVAILALCFPLTGLLWSALAALIVGALPLPYILQAKEGLSHD